MWPYSGVLGLQNGPVKGWGAERLLSGASSGQMVKQGVGLHPGGLGSAHQSCLPGLCTCEHTQLLQGPSRGLGGGGQEAGDPTVVLSL